MKENFYVQPIAGMDCLQKNWTKEKGRSLQTKEDIPSGSLVLQEDPYAAVLFTSFYCPSYKLLAMLLVARRIFSLSMLHDANVSCFTGASY